MYTNNKPKWSHKEMQRIAKNKNNKKTKKIKKHNRHQHNTDDGGQAMGEEMNEACA